MRNAVKEVFAYTRKEIEKMPREKLEEYNKRKEVGKNGFGKN